MIWRKPRKMQEFSKMRKQKLKRSRKKLERSSLKKMKLERNKNKTELLLKTLLMQRFRRKKPKKPVNLRPRKNEKNRRPENLSSNKKLRGSNFKKQPKKREKKMKLKNLSSNRTPRNLELKRKLTKSEKKRRRIAERLRKKNVRKKRLIKDAKMRSGKPSKNVSREKLKRSSSSTLMWL